MSVPVDIPFGTRHEDRLTMDPIEAFRADDAAVAVVGAGGKKTTMYTLANRLDHAVVTATVRIPIFDPNVATVSVTPDPIEWLHNAATAVETQSNDSDIDDPIGLVPSQERDDRYLGYDRETVSSIIEAHDGPVLIKADGARMREFKAPGESEPQIPDGVDVVVPVASVAAVGEPLTAATVHRPERVVELARDAGIDITIGDTITPAVVGTVLAHPDGGLAGIPEDACAIPLLNKVDDADAATIAHEVATVIQRQLSDRRRESRNGSPHPSVPHIVLGRLIDGDIVETVPVDDTTSAE